MQYDLPEFLDKEVVFIGKNHEGENFEKFIRKYADIRMFRYVDEADGRDYLENLQRLDFTKSIIVKSADCPGRLVPAPFTTTTKVFFNCIRQNHVKTVGVTGTRGKTTTSALLAHILKNAGYNTVLAGNMGTHLLDSLESISDQSVVVIELTSFQLAELEVSPDMAIITNLYRDHIDYHGKLESYWEAKRNIMRYMDTNGSVIFNPQTDIVSHWLAESEAHQIPINFEDQVDMTKTDLFGDFNRINFLLARKAAETLGVDRFTAQSALHTFRPVRHRLQKVKTVKGIIFVDDSIANEPDATVAAITSCVREVGPVGCVMLGGKDGDYDFSGIAKILSTLMIPKLVFFPDTGAKIKALLPDDYEPEMLGATDMDVAVRWAAERCPSGSVCLISSGSPTGSLWKDFEEKGDLYQNAILALST